MGQGREIKDQRGINDNRTTIENFAQIAHRLPQQYDKSLVPILKGRRGILDPFSVRMLPWQNENSCGRFSLASAPTLLYGSSDPHRSVPVGAAPCGQRLLRYGGVAGGASRNACHSQYHAVPPSPAPGAGAGGRARRILVACRLPRRRFERRSACIYSAAFL